MNYNLEGLLDLIQQRETPLSWTKFQLWSSSINNISSVEGGDQKLILTNSGGGGGGLK